jgi:hypothetical protein
MNEELLKSYEELKRNRNIINKIEPDFFFEIVDCLLKENEELKFEERRRIIGKYGDAEIHDIINRTLSNDYIPVQIIEDFIKKYQKLSDEFYEKFLETNRTDKDLHDTGLACDAKVDVLQQLLEGRRQDE